MRKKDHHPIYHLGKMYDSMMLFKPTSIKQLKNPHQFSCKIQVFNCLLSEIDIAKDTWY